MNQELILRACEAAWNTVYPERRPWKDIHEDARKEWVQVFSVFLQNFLRGLSDAAIEPAISKPILPECGDLCEAVKARNAITVPSIDFSEGVSPSGDALKMKIALEVAVEALSLYADPASYHAVSVFSDSPAGWFAEDVSEVDHPFYQRPMHGAEARKAIKAMASIFSQNAPTVLSIDSEAPFSVNPFDK